MAVGPSRIPGAKKRQKIAPPESWKQAAWPPHGDADKRDTFCAVGAALTTWGIYEAELGRLFCALMVRDLPSPAANNAFGAIRTFEGRLAVLRKAGAAYFAYHQDETYQSTELIQILNIGQRACERRNEIAHGIVQRYLPSDSSIHDESKGYCLFPAGYDSFRRGTETDRPDFCYSSIELSQYTLKFEELQKAPHELTNSIISHARDLRAKYPRRLIW
jgi:hypothetical protein